MKITLNNYEIYFLDHFDGNLPVEDEKELVLFLESNPELKEEFNSFSNINLDQEEIIFTNKASLKKTKILVFSTLNEENYEDSFIAYFEGDLSDDKKLEVEKFINLNPSLKAEFDLHNKLFLNKEEIIFDNKVQLKKKLVIFPWQFKTTMATAASIILLISVFWFLQDKSAVDNRELLNLSMAEPRNISLQNDVNTEIANRKIDEIFFVEQNAIVDVNKVENNSENLVLRNSKINFISNQGNHIAITGEIECAKLVKHEEVSEVLYAALDKNKSSASIFGRIVNNNTNKLARAINPEKEKRSKLKDKDPFLIKFMQGSVAVFNTITGSDIEELKVYDQQGNLKNYQVETQLLSMNKKFPIHGAE